MFYQTAGNTTDTFEVLAGSVTLRQKKQEAELEVAELKILRFSFGTYEDGQD